MLGHTCAFIAAFSSARVVRGLVLAAAVLAAAPAYALEPQIVAFSTRPDADGLTRVAVHLSGPVTNDAFERLFGADGLLSPNRWAPKSIVYLESQGGNVDEAIRIGEEFRKRGIWTAVRPNDTCASACVSMLLGGERRWLEVGSLVVIHAPEVVGPGAGDTALRGRILESLKERLITMTAMANVDRALVDNMFATPSTDPRLVRDTEAAMWRLASDFGDPLAPFLYTEPVSFPKPVKG